MTLSEALKNRRVALGMTQDELADKVAVTRQAVSGWETGRTEPDIGTLRRLAEALETDVNALVGEADAEGAETGPKHKARCTRCLLWAMAGGVVFAALLTALCVIKPLAEEVRTQRFDFGLMRVWLLLRPLAALVFGFSAACTVRYFVPFTLPVKGRLIALAAAALLLLPGLTSLIYMMVNLSAPIDSLQGVIGMGMLRLTVDLGGGVPLLVIAPAGAGAAIALTLSLSKGTSCPL